MPPDLNRIFHKLGPQVQAEFYPYSMIKHSIRRRDEVTYIRISDTFVHAPEEVLLSLGRMLLAKLKKRRVDHTDRKIYTDYVRSEELQKFAERVLVNRRRKVRIIKGVRDLGKSFERVNSAYFGGKMEKPVLTWSARRARRTLGKYDVERDIVFISPILDSQKVPEEFLDFIMYHELLHKKHGIRQGRNEGRRRIHTAAFKRDERKFRDFEKMRKFIEKVARMR